jgi:hypothetical protein
VLWRKKEGKRKRIQTLLQYLDQKETKRKKKVRPHDPTNGGRREKRRKTPTEGIIGRRASSQVSFSSRNPRTEKINPPQKLCIAEGGEREGEGEKRSSVTTR